MTEGESPSRQLQRESYGLRSLFFYRKLQEGKFSELYQSVASLDCTSYDFTDLSSLGISSEAAEMLERQSIPICHVFCHPVVIRENPRLLVYYRGVAAISQKGAGKLANVSVASYEQGLNRRPMPPAKATAISQVLNRLISSIVANVLEFDLGMAQSQVLMTAGVQADGSWRAEIGAVAAALVKEMIIKDLLNHDQLIAPVALEAAIVERVFVLRNGYRIVFGSDPDISIQDSRGTEVTAIEVKGGLDEAAALERYGAAKKSFDHALSKNSSVITVYLASTPLLTDRVLRDISTDRLVRETYNLSRVLVDDTDRDQFLDQLYWWLHLQRH